MVVDQRVLRSYQPVEVRRDEPRQSIGGNRDQGVVRKHPRQHAESSRSAPTKSLYVWDAGPGLEPQRGAEQPVRAVLQPEGGDIRLVARQARANIGDVGLHAAGGRRIRGRGHQQPGAHRPSWTDSHDQTTRSAGDGAPRRSTQLQACIPSGVKAIGRISPSSCRSRSVTAGRQSNGQYKNMKPPPPAPLTLPPTAPSRRASSYISSMAGVVTASLVRFFACHSSCKISAKSESRPVSNASFASSVSAFIRSIASRTAACPPASPAICDLMMRALARVAPV